MLSPREKKAVLSIVDNEGFWYGLTQYTDFRDTVKDPEFLQLVRKFRTISDTIEKKDPDLVEFLSDEGGMDELLYNTEDLAEEFPAVAKEIKMFDRIGTKLAGMLGI